VAMTKERKESEKGNIRKSCDNDKSKNKEWKYKNKAFYLLFPLIILFKKKYCNPAKQIKNTNIHKKA
jgi:hypothetical protein